MDDDSEKPRLSRGAQVAIVTLVLVALGGSAYGFLAGPVAIDPARLGCEPSDTASGEMAPVGRFDRSAPTAAPMAWAGDVQFGDFPAGSLPFAVDANASRAVAVGRIDRGGGVWQPLIATTGDGLAWHLAKAPNAGIRDGDLVDVAVGPLGWIAVGSLSTDARGGRAGVIYRSDDGEHWERLPDQPPQYLSQVAFGDRGAIILGSGGDDVRTLGSSIDGRSWTWRDPMIRNGGFAAIAWATDEWVAVGQISISGDDGVPAVWRSKDGIAWRCRLLPTRPDAPFGIATGVIPGTDTTLITGQLAPPCPSGASCVASSSGWTADADERWSLATPESTRRGPTTTLADGSFVSIDGEGSWHSTDGVTWQRLADPSPRGSVDAIARFGSDIVAVGTIDSVTPLFGLLAGSP